jgi:hypothetical protein
MGRAASESSEKSYRPGARTRKLTSARNDQVAPKIWRSNVKSTRRHQSSTRTRHSPNPSIRRWVIASLAGWAAHPVVRHPGGGKFAGGKNGWGRTVMQTGAGKQARGPASANAHPPGRGKNTPRAHNPPPASAQQARAQASAPRLTFSGNLKTNTRAVISHATSKRAATHRQAPTHPTRGKSAPRAHDPPPANAQQTRVQAAAPTRFYA